MTPALKRLHLLPIRLLLLGLLLLALPGCLSERDFPPHWDRLVHLPNVDHLSTRDWAVRIHQAASSFLPRDRDSTLTTDQLIASDISGTITPTDVWKHFDLNPDHLDNILFNLRGIEQTAQTVSPSAAINGKPLPRAPWDGFSDLQVPVPGATLWARLGVPDKQNEIPGSYVIVTHGLFGTLDGKGVINHLQSLRRAGHHVLALEMRGHGETFLAHHDYAITFGVQESGDLLAAARWVKQQYGATRVGLVAFSLTGFEALMAAWLDGAAPVTRFTSAPLGTLLPPHLPAPAFNAGMFLISTPVGVLDVAEHFETKYTLLQAPVKATFQQHITQRLADFHCGPGYTLWDLARCEFTHGDLNTLYSSFNAAQPDLQALLDLSRNNWRDGAARMENIRIPVLLINSANDPLATAQGVANLFSREHNPNIGVILLPEGGHFGFTAYSADYYYSLLLNFFDPTSAPAFD